MQHADRRDFLKLAGLAGVTFTTPGTYPYFCSIHPHMTGKVVVKAS